jgi:tetratricopeptide (TPR) repeat protein
VLAALFGLNFFVPVIGLVATLVGVAAGSLFPQLLKPRVFNAVPLPQFTVDADEDVRRPRGAAARARLLNRAAPTAARVEALLALGSSGSPSTGGLLRELLADPHDDLRLLAYGMLDSREKEISGALARERRLLATAEEIEDREAAREIYGRLAQLHWELVYQGLVQGDGAQFSLEQAMVYAERALRDDTSDGPRWLLIGRIRLRRGELKQANNALRNAIAWGMPRRAVLPYLAELQFLQGRYEDVRKSMLELGGRPGSDALSAMQQYWVA